MAEVIVIQSNFAQLAEHDELPEPAALAQEAMDELEGAMEELRGILEELGEEVDEEAAA